MTSVPTRSHRVRDGLAWLGGADAGVLAQAPSARGRFVQMGLVLLTTAGLAVVSMSFALHDGLKVTSWWAVLPFGLFWGFVILNLDRFLVLSMGATRNMRHLAAMAVPRLLMAAVLALVISTPLVLRVFQSDITAEVDKYQLSQSEAVGKQEVASKEQSEAENLAKQIDEYQATLDGKLPGTVTSPALETSRRRFKELQRDVSAKRRTADAKYEEWQCELYGAGPKCRRASTRKGAGPLAGAKERQYREAAGQLAAAQDRLSAASATRDNAEKAIEGKQQEALQVAQADANAKLPALKQRLAALRELIARRAQQLTGDIQADTGILAQMRALSRIGDRDATLRWTHLAVAALFFLIEILPVTAKLLLSLGPPSAYDMIAQLKEDELKDKAKIDRAEARRISEGKSKTRINLEQHMRRREQEVGEAANDKVAEQMGLIVEAALEDWSEAVHEQLAHGKPPPANAPAPDPQDPAQPLGRTMPFTRYSRAPARDDGEDSTVTTGRSVPIDAPVPARTDDGYSLPDADDL